MTVIKCPGHSFKLKLEEGGWVCTRCGLKVRTRSAAEYLKGRRS